MDIEGRLLESNFLNLVRANKLPRLPHSRIKIATQIETEKETQE